MKKLTLLTFMFLSFSIAAFSQEKADDKIPTIDYCELIKSPETYRDKVLNVRGIFMYGFEAQIITGQACIGKSKVGTWISGDVHKPCEGANDPKLSRILNTFEQSIDDDHSLAGVFRGKFLMEGAYGHMNAFNYQLEVSCIQNASLLPAEMSGCKRIDDTLPFHYVSYEKTEMGIVPIYGTVKTPNISEQLAWLKVVNNSSCPIVLPVDKREADVLSNESSIAVIYNLSVKMKDHYKTLVPAKGPVERFVSNAPQKLSTLLPGNSVLFAVPLSYLKKTYGISIPFKFKDKNSDSNCEPFYISSDKIISEMNKK